MDTKDRGEWGTARSTRKGRKTTDGWCRSVIDLGQGELRNGPTESQSCWGRDRGLV